MRKLMVFAPVYLVASVVVSAATASPLPITFAESGEVRVTVAGFESGYQFYDVTALLYHSTPPYVPYWEQPMWPIASHFVGQSVSFPYSANDIIGFKARLQVYPGPTDRWVYTDPELTSYCKLYPRGTYDYGVDLDAGFDPAPTNYDLLLDVRLTPAPEPGTASLLVAGALLTLCPRPRRPEPGFVRVE